MTNVCKRCNTKMVRSTAIRGHYTMHTTEMVHCNKCPKCGYSNGPAIPRPKNVVFNRPTVLRRSDLEWTETS